ncbi:hypothetical protein EV363DRAFT_1203633 [Boletus edulis]|nr:hypothetical protein EV363DRAFT_1203633 [Boletus edulis]
MLPLSLLTAAQNKPMLVELKNGETFNGHLVNCDNFMNITLREVYQTSADGDRFWKLKECYIRGSTIKYLRVPDTLLDAVKEEQARAREVGRSARGAGPGTRGTSPTLSPRSSLSPRSPHLDPSAHCVLFSSFFAFIYIYPVIHHIGRHINTPFLLLRRPRSHNATTNVYRRTWAANKRAWQRARHRSSWRTG